MYFDVVEQTGSSGGSGTIPLNNVTVTILVIIIIAALVGVALIRRKTRNSTRFCIECGKALPKDANYCRKCGSSQSRQNDH
jgi:ribosomal protein L40E